METLGQYLKRERTLRQIPLKEIAARTRIHVKILQKLEADDYINMPASAFIKGFLKSYAKCVGLNIEDVMLRYQVMMGLTPATPLAPVKTRKFVSRKYIIGGIITASIIAVGLILFLSPENQSTISNLLSKNEAEKTNIEGDKWYPHEGKQYYLRSYQDVWVKIQVDDLPFTSFPMGKNTYKSFVANKQIQVFASAPSFVSLSAEMERFEPLSQDKKPDQFTIQVK